jgi:hypothetical protein
LRLQCCVHIARAKYKSSPSMYPTSKHLFIFTAAEL